MAGLLRHGFKASAERLAIEVRIELELNATDPLDSLQLCAKLGVPVLTIPELIASGASAHSVQCLLSPAAQFSALTVAAGTKRLIVYNPSHTARRRAN